MQTLRASSLLIAAQEGGRTAPIDLMAAARAEYGRLLDHLYEQGHYAPTIRVLIDGREAADISPLATPAQIDRVAIEIDLGPLFVFGRIEMAPLAPVSPFCRPISPRRARPQHRGARGGDGRRWMPGARRACAGRGERAADLGRSRDEPAEPAAGAGSGAATAHRARRSRRATTAPATSASRPLPDCSPAPCMSLRPSRPLRRGCGGPAPSPRSCCAPPSGQTPTAPSTSRPVSRKARRAAWALAPRSTAKPAGGSAASGCIATCLAVRNACGWRLRSTGSRRVRAGSGFALDAHYTRPATLNRDTDLDLGLNLVRLDEDRLPRRRADRRGHPCAAAIQPALSASAGLSLRWERRNTGRISREFGTFGLPLNGRAGHPRRRRSMRLAGII